jgi:hypothetical protein
MHNTNFRKSKDIELASETTIPNPRLYFNIAKDTLVKPVSNATSHQIVEDSFETITEKKT